MKIYHNPNCNKSNKTLRLILANLKLHVIYIVRKTELIWKENYYYHKMKNEEIIELIINYHNLLGRTIVINDNNGVIARHPKRVLELFD